MVRLKDTETKQIFFGSYSILFDPFFLLFYMIWRRPKPGLYNSSKCFKVINTVQGFQNHDRYYYSQPFNLIKIFRPFLLKNTKQTKKKTTTTYYGSSTPKPVKVHSDKSPNTRLSKHFMSIIIKMMMTSLIRNNKFWLIISISTGKYMSIEIDHWKASW